MSANIDLAEKIANRITTGGMAQGFPTAGMVLTDLVGNWSMQEALLAQPLAKVPYEPGAMQAVAKAIAKVYPPPRTSPFRVDEVIDEFKRLDLSSPALIAAIDKLSQMNWPDRRTVLKELATSSPSVGGQSYLATFQPALDALPNVDIAIRAAWMAARLGNGRHEVTKEDLPEWVKLADHSLKLPFQDMFEVFVTIGCNPEEIEGLIADIIADLDDLELNSPSAGDTVQSSMSNETFAGEWFAYLKDMVRSYDRTKMDFGKFEKPGKQPYYLYLGTAIHTAIAKVYQLKHSPEPTLPDEILRTNTTPVERIFNILHDYFQSKNEMIDDISALGRSAALAMPDIYELRPSSHRDQPPGWVYEIKSAGKNGEGLAKAVTEALAYTAVLNEWGLPALPGPITTVGISGYAPAPYGWVAYLCPKEGAIVYKHFKVPQERYQLQFPQPAEVQKKAEIKKKIEVASEPGLAIPVIIFLVGLFLVLIGQEWVILVPVVA